MDYQTALTRANEIKELLAPNCQRIEIAGGIRRKKEEPHDIELVAVPQFVAQVTLFDDSGPDVNTLDAMIHKFLENPASGLTRGDPDKAGKKAPCGPKYYRLKFKGEKLDVFSVIEPAQWGTVFLIRTGDADFSHWFVTRLWKFGLKSVDGHIENSKGETIPTSEEYEAFAACGLDFVEPENRNMQWITNFEASSKVQLERVLRMK